MNSNFEELKKFELQGKKQSEEKIETHMLNIIRGVIKKELVRRIENQCEMFPFTNKMSLHYVNFYIIKKRFQDAQQKVKNSILSNAKLIHRKEIRRIQKAFRTIEGNVINELPRQLEKSVLQKIILYVIYQWLKKEFYISKEEIRRFVYGFSVFYSALKPKSDPKQNE